LRINSDFSRKAPSTTLGYIAQSGAGFCPHLCGKITAGEDGKKKEENKRK